MHCPACDHDNMQGADLCAECGLDLAGLDVDTWGVSSDDPLLAAPLESLSIQPAPVLGPGAKVTEAVAMMRERDIGCVFVVDGSDELVGILSERDVLVRVAGPGRDPARTLVREVMTTGPTTLRPGDPLAWALHRMGVDGFRHLPVRRGDEPLGYLSLQDVLHAITTAG